MLTTSPPAPHVASSFVQATRIAAQRGSEQYQCDIKNARTFGNQEDSHKPKRVTFNERLVNAPTFQTEYQDFAPLKHAMEAVFVKSW